ncbi:MAG: MAPEG family protein [Pseudomonadales bacterium]
MELLVAYENTVAALGAAALLMLVQLLIADVLGIKAGHTPGGAISADHDNPLFRAARVVANTNESVAIFILGVAFAVLNGGSPQYLSYAAWGYVVARAAYAACYYLDLRPLRSVVFGVSLLALVAVLAIGAFT